MEGPKPPAGMEIPDTIREEEAPRTPPRGGGAGGSAAAAAGGAAERYAGIPADSPVRRPVTDGFTRALDDGSPLKPLMASPDKPGTPREIKSSKMLEYINNIQTNLKVSGITDKQIADFHKASENLIAAKTGPFSPAPQVGARIQMAEADVMQTYFRDNDGNPSKLTAMMTLLEGKIDALHKVSR